MSELTNILADTSARLLGELVTRDVLAGAEAGAWNNGLWAALEENGLTRALPPEDLGGLGAGFDAAFVIAFAAGKARAPVPLLETLAAGWLLGRAGIEQPDGPLGLIGEEAGLILGDTLSGTARAVPWGRQAAHFVAVVEGRVALVTADGAGIAEDANIAAEPRDHVTFSNAAVVAEGKLGLATSLPPGRTLGALMRAAQMAGAMEGAVAAAVTHARDRHQFGRPIGKFQAVQQALAVAAARAAEARAAAETAFLAVGRANDDLTDAEWAVAAAKLVAGEAAEVVYDATHQVLGAMGFTFEHELHFWTRRLWAWRGEFGADGQWAAEIGRRVLAEGAEALWPGLTARQGA